MSSVETALAAIRKVHADIGTAEFARLSGVPYSTVVDCQKRDFVGPSVETLQKFAVAAERKLAESDAKPSERAA